ncbi:MAG: glycogen debranching enzyme N-terminal domain-containing protein [Phycisphaerales bacterium]
MPDTGPPPGALRPDGSFAIDAGAGIDALRDTEWLLTTGLGGFAMGSALGMPTRRYHALLIASDAPPTHRVLALAQVADTLLLRRSADTRRIDLATFAFRGVPLHPDGHTRLRRFEKGLACRWVFEIDGHEVVRELTLGEDEERATLRWILPPALAHGAIEVTPLVALRDFHALLSERTAPRYQVDADRSECLIGAGGSALRLMSAGGAFTHDSHWWRDFQYAVEARRGFPACEDLYAPGRFRLTGEPQPDGSAICELVAVFEPPSRAPARTRRGERIERAAGAIAAGAPK